MKTLFTFIYLFGFILITTSLRALTIQLTPNSFNCGSAIVNVSSTCNFAGTAQVTIDGNPAGIMISNIAAINAGSFTFAITVSPSAPAAAVVRVRLLTSNDPTGCALPNAEATANISIQCACSVTLDVTSNHESCFGCNNGNAQAVLNGAGGMVNYLWSNGSSGSSLTGLPPGAYTVTAVDATGCTASGSVMVDSYVCTPLNVQTIVTHATCHDDCDGTIQLGPLSNGSTAYSVLWNEGQNVTFRQDLCAASYQLTITDFDNCTVSTNIQVLQPDEMSIITNSITHVTGSGSGQATFNLSGIQSGATCEVCDLLGICTICGEITLTSATAVDMAAGCYFVRITNPNGCTVLSDSVCIQDLSSSVNLLLNDEIQIYPNPANDKLNIENHSSAVIEQIIIRNTNGQILNHLNQSQRWIDTNTFASGIYLITITTNLGNITKPLIILH